MSDFIKPVRQMVSVKEAFASLLNADLVKDLHDNEQICPVCHGTGLEITDNPYGLSDDPDKRAGRFPYKHQSITFCRNCYNGVVRICPDCGKQLSKSRLKCDCEAEQRRRDEEQRQKEIATLAAAEKHGSSALGQRFVGAFSEYFPYNEGYFFSWDEFFDYLEDEGWSSIERPEYVWGTTELTMDLDAHDIVSRACEDLCEDAMDSIDSNAIKEMQDFLADWQNKHGVTAYAVTYKHAIRIPWKDIKESSV